MIVIHIALVYIVLGLVFCVAYLTRGVERLDEGAKGTGFVFKLLIAPGTIAFWPYLLKKWINHKA